MSKVLLMASLSFGLATTCLADDTYLGKLSANPYASDDDG